MRSLPLTRLPCLYSSTHTAIQEEFNVDRSLHAPVDIDSRLRAFATVMRSLLGSTTDFAFLLDDNKVVLVAASDKQHGPEQLEIADKSDCNYAELESVEAQLYLREETGYFSIPNTGFAIYDDAQLAIVTIRFSSSLLPTDMARRLLCLYVHTLLPSNPIEFNDNALSTLLARVAGHSPHAIAMISYEDSAHLQLTYGELHMQSDQIARWIESAFPWSQRIAICFERRLAFVPYILAILKSGRTYLAIDPSLSRSRKALAARSANADLLLTSSMYAKDFELLLSRCVIVVDTDGHRRHVIETLCSEVAFKPADPLCITFSGNHESSAQGELVSQYNLVSAVSAFATRIDQGIYLAWASLGSDVHLVELLAALSRGLTIANVLTEYLHARGLKAVLNETSAYQSIIPVRLLEKASLRPADAPQLKRIFLPGAHSSSLLLEEWHSVEDRSLNTMFGLPEFSGFCAFGEYGHSTSGMGSLRPGISAFILRSGSAQQGNSRGEAGDLYLYGESAGLLRSHSDDASLGSAFEGSLLPTGLIGRINVDESIECLGRSDTYRLNDGRTILLLDVSNSLTTHSRQPLDVVSLALDHPQGIQTRIVSFVARRLNTDSPCDTVLSIVSDGDMNFARSLFLSCRGRVPSHLIPDVIIPLNLIPLTSLLSNAVDIKHLRRIFYDCPLSVWDAQRSSTNEVCRPLSEKEERIRDVLSAVTKVQPDVIEASTTTLQLGVDSLVAISLSRNFKAAGFFVPPHVILTGPTVEKLAKASEPAAKEAEVAWEVDVKLKQQIALRNSYPVENVLPCLPLQEGLVALTLNHPEPVYVQHFITSLDSDIETDRLKSAIYETINANSILRTCFVTANNDIVQVVLSPSEDIVSWLEFDVEGDALASLHADKPAVERDLVAKIDQFPPVRLSLYRGSNESRFLCWTLHHAVYDGGSLPLIMAEVRARYTGPFSLYRPPIDRLLSYIARQSPEEARAFFTSYLGGAPRLPALPVVAGDSRRYRQRVSTPLSLLEEAARCVNVTLPTLALGAFGVALAERYSRSDIVIGLVLSGRTVLVDGIADMTAPCVTTVPARVRYDGQPVFSDVAAQVQEDMAPLIHLQYTPLRHIQRWLDVSEPLFNALFNFVRQDPDLSNFRLGTLLESKAILDYPLAVAVEANTHEDALFIRAGHLPAFGSDATTRALVARMSELLENPAQALHKLITEPDHSVTDKPVYDSTTWSEVEISIRDAVCEVCAIDKEVVTKEQSFLQLGVDSITSIRLAQLLRTRGLPVPTYAIMRNSCVGALAQFLRESTTENTSAIVQHEFSEVETRLMATYATDIPSLAKGDAISSIFPATPLQTGMLTETLSSNGQLYFVPHALRLNSGVSVASLHAAIEIVVAKTDILRCTFHAVADDYPWLAAVHTVAPLKWSRVRFESEEELHEGMQKIVGAERHVDEKSFEYPPLAVHFLEAHSLRILLLVIHHSLYDGLSLRHVLDDIASSYRGQDLTPRPEFRDVVPYILHSSQDRAKFWSKHLAGFLPSLLPCVSVNESETIRMRQVFALPQTAASAIKDMGVTMQTVTLLSWAKVLARLVNSCDVVFGRVVAGRAIELEDALLANGPLFNTIPFRFILSDKTWSNAEAAQEVQRAIIQGEPYQHVPLRKIQREWRLQNDAGGTALFDTLFVFQQGTDKKSDRSDLWTSYDISGKPSDAQYPLSLEIVHSDDKLELRGGCQIDIFSKSGLNDVLSTLRNTILDTITNPRSSVVSCPFGLQEVVNAPGSHQCHTSTRHVELDRDLSPNEIILRDVFASISKIPAERIGLTTPLYALGLDSVAAIQITARCRLQGLPISVSDVFDGETIAGICTVYAERTLFSGAVEQKDSRPLVVPAMRRMALDLLGVDDSDVEDVFPLLAGQDYHISSWFASGATFYQPVFAYKANIALDPVKVEQTWRELQRRHSILRTAFAATSPATIFQIVLKTPRLNDFRFFETVGDITEIAKQHAQEEYKTPATLLVPPARVRLLRVNGQDVLLLSLHHATYDGWSLPLLIADFCALYRGEECRSGCNFTDLVKHLHASRKAAEDSAMDMWRHELRDGSTLLPIKRPGVGLKQIFLRSPGVIHSVSSLQAKAQASGISLQSLVLAVWGRVIRKFTGAENPVVGIYHTARAADFEGIDVLAGPTVNVLPMRLPATDGAPVRDIARHLQAEMGRRAKYEQTNLRDIALWTRGEDSSPLFNAYLNLLWYGNNIRSTRDKRESMLQSFPIGPPTEFMSSGPLEGFRSSVDILDTSYLPLSNLGFFADIILDSETDSIRLAMRAHLALLDADELGQISEFFVNGIRCALEDL